MASSGPPRGFHTLPGIDPRTGKPCEFRIEVSLIEKVMKFDSAKAGQLRSVKEAILRPDRAWRGLNRDDQEDGLALLSHPRAIYFDTGENDFTQASPGMGFFVYCSARLLIHDWGWVDFHREEPTRGVVNGILDPKTAENFYCQRTFSNELNRGKA